MKVQFALVVLSASLALAQSNEDYWAQKFECSITPTFCPANAAAYLDCKQLQVKKSNFDLSNPQDFNWAGEKSYLHVWVQLTNYGIGDTFGTSASAGAITREKGSTNFDREGPKDESEGFRTPNAVLPPAFGIGLGGYRHQLPFDGGHMHVDIDCKKTAGLRPKCQSEGKVSGKILSVEYIEKRGCRAQVMELRDVTPNPDCPIGSEDLEAEGIIVEPETAKSCTFKPGDTFSGYAQKRGFTYYLLRRD